MVEVKIERIDVEPDWSDDDEVPSPLNDSEEPPPPSDDVRDTSNNTVWIKTEYEADEAPPLPYYNEVNNIVQTQIDPLPSFKCPDCGRGFASRRALAVHLVMCRDTNTYKCQLCNRVFASPLNLGRHQKYRCKLQQQGSLTCPHCHKVFTRIYSLKSHLKKHDDERPFQCELCQMWFKHKTSLERHKMLHADNKPFACHYCGKRFTTRTLMTPHLRTHTKERPFQCPICMKQFAHKHNMQRHTFQHNKIKHLVCGVCHKVFPRESRLKYHMRVHWEDNKPFKCTRCAKTYSHKQNILRHFQKKHPDVEYIAPDTDAGLATKAWERTVGNRGGTGDSIVPEEIGDSGDVAHVLPTEVVIVDGGEVRGDRSQGEKLPGVKEGDKKLPRLKERDKKLPQSIESNVIDTISSVVMKEMEKRVPKSNKKCSNIEKLPKNKKNTQKEMLPQDNNTQESLPMPKSEVQVIELLPKSECLVGDLPKYESGEKSAQIDKVPNYEALMTQVGTPLGSIVGI